MAALFIGGSNADRLANSAATLGIVAETITTAGWVLSTDAVTAILPQVTELCGSLPEGAPVVIYCLDNSSFCCANRDGQLSAIAKQKDGLFLVPGEIVVIHEVTLAAEVTNLKRLLVACGDRMVFIITPGPRYHGIPCCCSGDHCTHLQIPDSGIKLMQDLTRLHLFISRRLSSSANCSVLPACDLLTGKKNASPEEALSAFSTWGAVHGSNSNYTRMALYLVDNHFRKPPVSAAAAAQPAPPAPSTKRPRADSSSSYESGSESGLPIPALTSFRPAPLLQSASRPPAALPWFHQGRLPWRLTWRWHILFKERLQRRSGNRRPLSPLSLPPARVSLFLS
jgi:hypothetical protein